MISKISAKNIGLYFWFSQFGIFLLGYFYCCYNVG